MKQKKADFTVIKIKRGFLFLFGLVFFFFPGNNWYSVIQASYQPSPTQAIDLELPPPADYPVNFTGTPAPSLTARSVVVIDRDSAVVMSSKNEQTQLLPASTVKLMTALVALDYYDLGKILVVDEINRLGQDMKLEEEEKITVNNLLYGVLVTSANDAATLLAQNYPGGIEGFVKEMNAKAEELNLKDTYFANPTGLDVDERDNLLLDSSYSTALDLARLARMVMETPTLSEMVGTTQITVVDVTGKIKHQLYNINELLYWLPGMKGIKTGWTEEAGECLIGYVERDGRGVISVVLGSKDRFNETAKLIDWAFTNHQWQAIAPSIQEQ